MHCGRYISPLLRALREGEKKMRVVIMAALRSRLPRFSQTAYTPRGERFVAPRRALFMLLALLAVAAAGRGGSPAGARAEGQPQMPSYSILASIPIPRSPSNGDATNGLFTPTDTPVPT